MKQNITSRLKRRELNNRFDPDVFVKTNYFNESMIKRMTVEQEISLGSESYDDHITSGSWNHGGNLLGCGKTYNGVNIYAPFRKDQLLTTITARQNHFLSDVVFMHTHNNLISMALRNHNDGVNWTMSTGLNMESYVKVFDVEKSIATTTYAFRGLVKNLKESSALPNNIWFNIDQMIHTIAEADIRSNKYRLIKFSVVDELENLLHKRTFDIHPLDEKTIAVGYKQMLSFYDRRKITSSSVAQPVECIDFSSLNDDGSVIDCIKYNPCGNKIVLTNTRGLSSEQYVVSASDAKITNVCKLEDIESLAIVTLKTPKFLGEKYALFDVYPKSFAVVFDLERGRYIGKIHINENENSFSDISSFPHPDYCLIAAANEGSVSFITPTYSARKKITESFSL